MDILFETDLSIEMIRDMSLENFKFSIRKFPHLTKHFCALKITMIQEQTQKDIDALEDYLIDCEDMMDIINDDYDKMTDAIYEDLEGDGYLIYEVDNIWSFGNRKVFNKFFNYNFLMRNAEFFREYLRERLDEASFYGHLAVVKFIVENIEQHGSYLDDALSVACSIATFKVVKYLVSKGAKFTNWCVRNLNELIGAPDTNYQRFETSKFLLEYGLNPSDLIQELSYPLRCYLAIEKIRRERRVRWYLKLLRRFILKREAVKRIVYLPKVGMEYYRAKEAFEEIFN